VATTLEVGLHSAHIEDVSSVPLFRGAASIENVFAPHKSRDHYVHRRYGQRRSARVTRLNCSGGLCVYIAEGLGLHRATR
jgi:hypothetical protein